jgi:hypothetical protein
MLLMLKLAIFIVQLHTRGVGWRSASHLNRFRSRFGCGHTTDRSSVSRLAYDLMRANNQEVAAILT